MLDNGETKCEHSKTKFECLTPNADGIEDTIITNVVCSSCNKTLATQHTCISATGYDVKDQEWADKNKHLFYDHLVVTTLMTMTIYRSKQRRSSPEGIERIFIHMNPKTTIDELLQEISLSFQSMIPANSDIHIKYVKHNGLEESMIDNTSFQSFLTHLYDPNVEKEYKKLYVKVAKTKDSSSRSCFHMCRQSPEEDDIEIPEGYSCTHGSQRQASSSNTSPKHSLSQKLHGSCCSTSTGLQCYSQEVLNTHVHTLDGNEDDMNTIKLFEDDPIPNTTDVQQYHLGIMYYYGEGTAVDYSKAFEYFQTAAHQGNIKAQLYLGVMYHNGEGTAQDYSKAMEWYFKAATQGDDYAQLNLGVMYHNGQGVIQNEGKAFKWYEKSANQGNAKAQYSLGLMYEHGEYVSKDWLKAIEYFLKSAKQDNAEALFRLGGIYCHGRNFSKAFKYIQQAARCGHSEAQYLLGVLYSGRFHVPQDYSKASEWYLRAAHQGHAEAQFELGKMYEQGLGVLSSDSQALEWYRKSANNGNTSALKSLVEIVTNSSCLLTQLNNSNSHNLI
ncbi:hypothetical protein C9374_002221 [Naegleria lovaniensis]|uniref:Uncharacterized protein n=1 Tax=Naegleria lovaniensis TaxID=51637 RepID=A0AA88GSZ5_NAELO|nr:uncharacterized protein C9374_002221 [Naegleria lovaniensis]KAG2386477.1 hypothetical protein C9374_002221 [Naegleria lovaniensis]